MDTKLRNYKYSAWFKLVAIALCIAGVLTAGYGLLKGPFFEYAFDNLDFKKSQVIRGLFYDVFENVSYISLKYKNEENIKSGATLDKEQVSYRISNLISQQNSDLDEVERNYNQLINQYKNDFESKVANPSAATKDESKNIYQERIDLLESQKAAQINQINQKYSEMIDNVEMSFIEKQLSDYHTRLRTLNKVDGMFYTVVSDGKDSLSNLPQDSYGKLPVSVKLTDSNVMSYFSDTWHWDSYDILYKDNPIPMDTTIYLGMSEEKYQNELAAFNQNRSFGLSGVVTFAAGLLALLLGLIYLIYAAGRSTASAGANLIAVDFIYLDIALVVSFGLTSLCLSPIFVYGRYLFSELSTINTDLLKIAFSILLVIETLIAINFILMLTRRLKRHEAIKYTLVYKILYWIFSKIKRVVNAITRRLNSVYDRSPLAVRLILIFLGYAFSILVSILLLIAGSMGILMGFSGLIGINVLTGYMVLKTFKSIKDISTGAERIRAGELSYIIPEGDIPELRKLSMTINSIADGFKNAVSSQVKSERMKTELITNVSHDLKTPLTSIITYVDLLKAEGLQSENASKYLDIIDTKSQRLKALTEDLFEAAKATSGNISVNLDKLDVVSLINQGLGELSDRITASGLNFKTTLPSEKVYVKADGKLLWRVIENLLSNVFKYALPNSRVYIDAAEDADTVRITIKNISAYELNIPENELMERFIRGDASRHSEGSGLGLSIAKSLTELQGGSLRIEIDGDLFKATIELSKAY